MPFVVLHQKVVIALIAGVTIISISGIVVYFQKETQLKNPSSTGEKKSLVEDSGDSDGDGAPDWQEILYGTDPSVTDTDGDGVEDKEEIEIIKKERQKGFVDSVSGDVPPNTTTTQITADRLIGAYIIQQQQNGGEVSEKEKDAIVKSTVQTLSQLQYTQYTEKDLSTSPNLQASAIEEYRNAVRVKLKPLEAIPEYELQIYARAVDKNDPAEFEKLKKAADIYSKIAKELLTVPVPEDAVENHLKFINGFMYTSASLASMSKGYDDVIASYRALGHFGKAERQLKMAQEALRVYFTVKDIDPL